MGYRPVKVSLGGGTFELHRDGKVYTRRPQGHGSLIRVKDAEIINAVREAFRKELRKRRAHLQALQVEQARKKVAEEAGA